ncbi:MAG: hypothetical protein HOC93_04725 [Phycisphaerae bacterium]|jgi:4-hydroxybenzoate polyprenyltransferase|nr:hypothetical protein [Phycisphaerae bacterium]|tara:strand:+ start:26 stop:766 length:741 start_codon:yes stop_codon:yes gene_type:complete
MTTFGIWASLYVGSVVVLMFQIAGERVTIAAVVGSCFLAMAVYVLHRISPEVHEAIQPRHRQAIQKRKTMLFLFGLASIVACGMLYMVKPILLLLLPIGCIAVTLYGRKTVCYPIRNIIFLKSIAVGISIAGLGWILIHTPWPPVGAIGIAVIISADALLCDIQDVQYDKGCGCITLPARTTESTTWLIASAMNIIGACFLWFVGESIVGWIALLIFPILFIVRKYDLRMFVDLRLPLVAVILWLL